MLLDQIWLLAPWLSGWRGLAVSAFVLGLVIALCYRPFSMVEVGDASIYDYIAQTILRGGLPYRDVVEIKAPGAIYLSALAMLLGRHLAISDIIAVRLLNILLIGALSFMTFVVSWTYLRSRLASVIAVLLPLMMGSFTIMMNGGTQPKLPLMIFGLCSLYLTARDRPFWAGLFSMLCCLCWQPGLLFTGVVFLMFTRYLTRWRDFAWLKVLAGAAIPLGITLLYFYSRGALRDLWSWTITFNYSVFAPNGLKPLSQSLRHFWKVVSRVYEWDSIAVWMSVAGFVWYSYRRVRAKFGGVGAFGGPALYRDAIAIPPLIYLAFCTINFQGGPDLIPFLPFIGIFGGWFFIRAARFLFSGRIELAAHYLTAQRAFCLLVVITLGMITLYRGVTYRVENITLQAQSVVAEKVARLLAPGDAIYVHGAVELLVLLDIPNLNPYVAFDSGADDYLAAGKPHGFASVVEGMEAAAPKVVVLTRLANIHHADELMHWVNQHYQRLPQFDYAPLWVRTDGSAPAQ
jgi:hypothetical protein